MALPGDRIRIINRANPFFADGKTTGKIVAADGRGNYVAQLERVVEVPLDDSEFIVLPKPREARP